MKQNIAIVTDSCTDVPAELIEKYGIYVIPVIVQYADQAYLDRVDISEEDVYARLSKEVPTTSLPTPEYILNTFDRIVADGYKQAVVVTMSANLSGTFNTIRLLAEEYEGLDIATLNTKNIGIGAGFAVITAAELAAKGADKDEIVAKVSDAIEHTKVFFSLKTLDYLRKGGRIGLVTGIIGNVLNIKPVISCKEEGVYYTVKKSRGVKQSLADVIKFAREYADKLGDYNIAVCDGDSPEEAQMILSKVKEYFPNAKSVYHTHVSPALVVHTGPGLIGISVQKIVS